MAGTGLTAAAATNGRKEAGKARALPRTGHPSRWRDGTRRWWQGHQTAIPGALRAWTVAAAVLLLLPSVAHARDLKLTTWNIEWATLRPAGDPALPPEVHPKTPADLALLHGYAARLNADVVALEEVEGAAVASQLFPPAGYALEFIHDHVVQQVGLAIRRTIPYTRNPDLAALDLYPDAPHPLRSGLDVTLHLPGTDLRVLAVHLKTGCREDPLDRTTRPACRTLARQVPALAGWIAQRRAEGIPFVLMGDFNRWMDGNDQVLAAMQEAAPLARATEGRSERCWRSENFIDHILAGGPARAWLQPDTLRVMIYTQTGPEWQERLSDHCPVSVTLAVP